MEIRLVMLGLLTASFLPSGSVGIESNCALGIQASPLTLFAGTIDL